jgi:AraC-like DNA-binding protein
MAADALSSLLRAVRLTGATFFDIVARDSWALASPAKQSILPKILPGADHLIAYHVVTDGRCFARVAGGEAIALEAGEVVVFTNSDPHVMSSSPTMKADPMAADVLDVALAGQMPFRINHGAGGAGSTKLVCGYLACDAQLFNPLLDALPPVIKVGDLQQGDSGWLGQFIRFAVAEISEKRPGGDSVLTRLSELMFIDVLRRYIETVPPEKSGWLAGLRDPLIGKALALIHEQPADPWTIDMLAKRSGMSRTMFAERFSELVGIPPMYYLAKWRMQVASELLIDSNANLASIAPKIGYESEAAFSRAFKRLFGVPPSAWRGGVRVEAKKAS